MDRAGGWAPRGRRSGVGLRPAHPGVPVNRPRTRRLGNRRGQHRGVLMGAALAAVTVLAISCASEEFAVPTTTLPPTTAPATTVAPNPDCHGLPPTASYDPLSPMPAPGQMPAGSTMARIAASGRLVVG